MTTFYFKKVKIVIQTLNTSILMEVKKIKEQFILNE